MLAKVYLEALEGITQRIHSRVQTLCRGAEGWVSWVGLNHMIMSSANFTGCVHFMEPHRCACVLNAAQRSTAGQLSCETKEFP